MDSLWKKEKDETLFVDLFTGIDSNFAAEWDEYLQSIDTKQKYISCKDNVKSDELMRKGNLLQHQINTCEEALALYTKALCFAEVGTENVALALQRRANCYYKLGMYPWALCDIELAHRENCTPVILSKLRKLKDDCDNSLKNITVERPGLKPTPPANENYPCLANFVTFKNNSEFGRHLIAKSDIEVGQTVAFEDNYAAVLKESRHLACYTCLKEDANFIACSKCSVVVFCSSECMDASLHPFDCHTLFHQLLCKEKLLIHTILIAITTYPDFKQLMDCVNEVERDDEMPGSINDEKSKYRLYLKLKKCQADEAGIQDVYSLSKSIMHIPSISKFFDSKEKQRFLEHLIFHHLAVNTLNGSESELAASVGCVMSLFNHSCAPNLYNYSIGNRKYAMTIRPVKKGEQLFISYIGIGDQTPTQERQNSLKKRWAFQCKCIRCEPRAGQLNESNKMKLDPAFKFIQRYAKTAGDYTNVPNLKKKCIKFLTKFGHVPDSNELQIVMDVYISLLFLK